MVNGRGAWNVSGLGGTKKYKDATKPGPYYYIGTGKSDGERDENDYVVYRAVMAYQRALNRRLSAGLVIDGWFGEKTSEAVTNFQEKFSEKTGTPWGGIGPDTSKTLFEWDVNKIVLAERNSTKVTSAMVSGTIRHESNWDAGAVGFVDVRDVGLAQINAAAHPDLTLEQRLDPMVSFKFVVNYYDNALAQLNGNVRDSIASYNLGIGGARRWISQGRPDWYTPTGQTQPRNVKAYIDSILAG